MLRAHLLHILRVNIVRSPQTQPSYKDNNASSKMVIMFSRNAVCSNQNVHNFVLRMRIPNAKKKLRTMHFSAGATEYGNQLYGAVVFKNWFSLFFTSILNKCRTQNRFDIDIFFQCVQKCFYFPNHITLLMRMIVCCTHFCA